jgi:hypothetical protein
VSVDPPEPADPASLAWLSEVLSAHAGAVRVYWVVATTMQGLVDRLAVLLGEHMTTGDELHVTYNAMQSGWQHHPAQPRSWTHPPQAPWTELRLEYSALLVLRSPTPPPLGGRAADPA